MSSDLNGSIAPIVPTVPGRRGSNGGNVYSGGGVQEEPSFTILLPTVLGTLGCLSQVVMILIARGLRGDYSAKTFLWFLSVAQILQQLSLIYLAICGSSTDFCVLRENDTQCKMLIQLTWWFWLMPDWLAVPVSLDRLNAILSPVWYKENCTTRSAWLVIIPLVVLIGVTLFPISLMAQLVQNGQFRICVTSNGKAEQFMSLVGLPAIAIVSVSTLVLGVVFHKRRALHSAAHERAATLALTGNSCMYALFGTVSYCFVFYAFMILTSNNADDLIFYLGIGQMVNSSGLILRSPILLLMRPMRLALKRGLRDCCKCRTQVG
ncbi:uncharacterized protein LOC134839670 [Symsagittifera roscoffensis]|uniref:uncharacterized protein LOC134839670 n=1 Tax=Symsagittifera roscoffensis TaxID=84072 RepID=UPI00307C1DDE